MFPEARLSFPGEHGLIRHAGSSQGSGKLTSTPTSFGPSETGVTLVFDRAVIPVHIVELISDHAGPQCFAPGRDLERQEPATQKTADEKLSMLAPYHR